MVVCYLILFLFFFLTTFFLLKNGWTALHLAVFKGSEQIVKILVEHGANVHPQDPVLIFIFISFVFSDFICCCGVHFGLFHVDSEWFLCCVIFDFVFVLFLTTFFLLKDGWTALHHAAWRGFEQIVKILVEHRSNINIQTKVFIFFFFFFKKYFFVATVWALDGFFFFETFFSDLFYCVRMGKQFLMSQKIRTLLNWSSNWRFYFFISLLFFLVLFLGWSWIIIRVWKWMYFSYSFFLLVLIVVGKNDKTSSTNKKRKLKFWQ